MISFLVSTISLAVVFLYGCLGETIMEKAGHLNLGIPGIMCLGTAGGCLGASWYVNSLADPNSASWFVTILCAILVSVAFSCFGGAIYAFLTVSLRCNQNITGLAVTTFGSGLTQFLMGVYYVPTENHDIAANLLSAGVLKTGTQPTVWHVFFSHGFFVYFAIILAVVAGFFLKKTRVGLHLRSIGESPATADAAGINVTAYKYVAILVGSAISGFGGLFYIMDFLKGSWENASAVEAFGWMAIALVIFTLWKPTVSIFGSLIFGAFYIMAFFIDDIPTQQKEILKLLPYFITIIVLIATSIAKNKENQAPAALGLAYFREER